MRFWNKTFALTMRALRLDARRSASHLHRFGFCVVILFNLLLLRRQEVAAAPGRELIEWITYGNAVLASMAIPLLFGNAITEEKESRTLSLLRIADVEPLAILAGKTIPRLVALLLVLIVQFPFTLLGITLGGVTYDQIVAAYVAVGAYMLFLAGLSVGCSVPFRLTANATGAAGLLILAFHLVPLFASLGGSALAANAGIAAFWRKIGDLLVTAAEPINSANVFVRLRVIFESGAKEPILTGQVIANLALALGAFLLAWASFDFFNRDLEGASAADASVPRRKGRHLPRAWEDPIAWKEFHHSMGGPGAVVWRVVIYAMILVFVPLVLAGGEPRAVDRTIAGPFLTAVFASCLMIETTLIIARLLHMEVKGQTLSSLLLLPISTRGMLASKLKGGMLAVVPVTLFALTSLAISPEMTTRGWIVFCQFPGTIVGTAAVVIVNVLLLWNLSLLFSLSMNPLLALLAAYFLQYYGSLILYGPLGLALDWYFGPVWMRDVGSYLLVGVNGVVTTVLVGLMFLGLPWQIEEKGSQT